jgi:hypothetical protein
VLSICMRKYEPIKEKEIDDLPLNLIDQLNEVVLWNVVSQCAGTMSHAPEKVLYQSDCFLSHL